MRATTKSTKLGPKFVKDGFKYTILRENSTDVYV